MFSDVVVVFSCVYIRTKTAYTWVRFRENMTIGTSQAQQPPLKTNRSAKKACPQRSLQKIFLFDVLGKHLKWNDFAQSLALCFPCYSKSRIAHIKRNITMENSCGIPERRWILPSLRFSIVAIMWPSSVHAAWSHYIARVDAASNTAQHLAVWCMFVNQTWFRHQIAFMSCPAVGRGPLCYHVIRRSP